MKTLDVTHTQCRFGKPLATLHNLPGEGADMTPAAMRLLARALLEAADECESRPMAPRKFLRKRVAYVMAPEPQELVKASDAAKTLRFSAGRTPGGLACPWRNDSPERDAREDLGRDRLRAAGSDC